MIDRDSWNILGQYALPWDMMALAMTCKQVSQHKAYPMPAEHIIMQAIETGDERYIYDICRAHAAKVPKLHSLIGGLLKQRNLIKALSATCPYICGPAWNLDDLGSYTSGLNKYIAKLKASQSEEKIPMAVENAAIGSGIPILPFAATSIVAIDASSLLSSFVADTSNTAIGTSTLLPTSTLTIPSLSGHMNSSRLSAEPAAAVSGGNSWSIAKNRAPDGLDLKMLHFAETVQAGEFTIGSQHYPLEVMFDPNGHPVGFVARINGYRCMIPLIFLPDF